MQISICNSICNPICNTFKKLIYNVLNNQGWSVADKNQKTNFMEVCNKTVSRSSTHTFSLSYKHNAELIQITLDKSPHWKRKSIFYRFRKVATIPLQSNQNYTWALLAFCSTVVKIRRQCLWYSKWLHTTFKMHYAFEVNALCIWGKCTMHSG